jgi:hypothetical protein
MSSTTVRTSAARTRLRLRKPALFDKEIADEFALGTTDLVVTVSEKIEDVGMRNA